jgi:peptidoglycan hydrolase FlgJ
MFSPIEPGSSVAMASQDRLAGLKKTCIAFESLFISYILKSQEPLDDGNSFFGNNKIIRSMFDEAFARGIADGGGMGLADMLFERLNQHDEKIQR